MALFLLNVVISMNITYLCHLERTEQCVVNGGKVRCNLLNSRLINFNTSDK